jgi:hypothetical protein
VSIRATILAAAAAVLLALAVFFVAACGRLQWMCVFGVVFLWLFGIAPATALLALILWKRRTWRHAIVVLTAWLAFVVLTVPTLKAADLALELRIHRARLAAERVADTIDTFRERHGRLPRDLAEVRRDGLAVRVPSLAPSHFYEPYPDNDSYALYVDDPAGDFLDETGWIWRSDTGRWLYYGD